MSGQNRINKGSGFKWHSKGISLRLKHSVTNLIRQLLALQNSEYIPDVLYLSSVLLKNLDEAQKLIGDVIDILDLIFFYNQHNQKLNCLVPSILKSLASHSPRLRGELFCKLIEWNVLNGSLETLALEAGNLYNAWHLDTDPIATSCLILTKYTSYILEYGRDFHIPHQMRLEIDCSLKSHARNGLLPPPQLLKLLCFTKDPFECVDAINELLPHYEKNYLYHKMKLHLLQTIFIRKQYMSNEDESCIELYESDDANVTVNKTSSLPVETELQKTSLHVVQYSRADSDSLYLCGRIWEYRSHENRIDILMNIIDIQPSNGQAWYLFVIELFPSVFSFSKTVEGHVEYLKKLICQCSSTFQWQWTERFFCHETSILNSIPFSCHLFMLLSSIFFLENVSSFQKFVKIVNMNAKIQIKVASCDDKSDSFSEVCKHIHRLSNSAIILHQIFHCIFKQFLCHIIDCRNLEMAWIDCTTMLAAQS